MEALTCQLWHPGQVANRKANFCDKVGLGISRDRNMTDVIGGGVRHAQAFMDRKFREIVKLDPVLEFQSRLYQATSGKLLELRLGPLEDLFLLTGPDPVILLRDQGGEWKEHQAGEESLGSRPEDFAVDGLRNLYVLSDRGGRLRVLSPSGETIALLDVATYSDGSRFLPNRVAADGAGSIYLCNRKGTRIVRYR